jgi:hypothetical protein
LDNIGGWPDAGVAPAWTGKIDRTSAIKKVPKAILVN